jgi:hypothetical protein
MVPPPCKRGPICRQRETTLAAVLADPETDLKAAVVTLAAPSGDDGVAEATGRTSGTTAVARRIRRWKLARKVFCRRGLPRDRANGSARKGFEPFAQYAEQSIGNRVLSHRGLGFHAGVRPRELAAQLRTCATDLAFRGRIGATAGTTFFKKVRSNSYWLGTPRCSPGTILRVIRAIPSI